MRNIPVREAVINLNQHARKFRAGLIGFALEIVLSNLTLKIVCNIPSKSSYFISLFL